MTIQKPTGLIRTIDAMILLYAVSIYILSYHESTNGISKAIAFGLMGLLALYVLADNCKMVFSYYSLGLLLFVLLCYFSRIWALNAAFTYEKTSTMLQLFLLTTLLYHYLYREKKGDFFIMTICIAGTSFAVYTIFYYGVADYFSGLLQGVRMGAEITNVNTIGMATLSSLIISFWYVLYRKKKWCVIPLIISGITALGSGSRKVIFSLAVSILLMVFLRGNYKRKLQTFLQSIAALGVLYLILQLPIFSTLLDSVEEMLNGVLGTGETDTSTAVRMDMLRAGMASFRENPILGIGIGNAAIINKLATGRQTYLHNNYVELLASVGLVGTILFYSVYAWPLPSLLRQTSQRRSESILALTLLLVDLVIQFGQVTYYLKNVHLQIILYFLIANTAGEPSPAPQIRRKRILISGLSVRRRRFSPQRTVNAEIAQDSNATSRA